MTKPKPVNWELINNNDAIGKPIYELTDKLIKQYYSVGTTSLENLGIVIMWRHNVKPDIDGFLLLSDISKSPDKVRELMPHDMVIGVNKMAWDLLNDQQKAVVIDTQLDRVAVCLSKDGEPKEDDKFRLIYRLRRIELADDEKMLKRHGTTMANTQEYILEKMLGAYEKGSYFDRNLNDRG